MIMCQWNKERQFPVSIESRTNGEQRIAQARDTWSKWIIKLATKRVLRLHVLTRFSTLGRIIKGMREKNRRSGAATQFTQHQRKEKEEQPRSEWTDKKQCTGVINKRQVQVSCERRNYDGQRLAETGNAGSFLPDQSARSKNWLEGVSRHGQYRMKEWNENRKKGRPREEDQQANEGIAIYQRNSEIRKNKL